MVRSASREGSEHGPYRKSRFKVRPRTRSSYPVIRFYRATAARLTRRPGMSPRASTLKTPPLLATPSRAQAIGFASPPVGRWVTSHEHTPGVPSERLSLASPQGNGSTKTLSTENRSTPPFTFATWCVSARAGVPSASSPTTSALMEMARSSCPGSGAAKS